MTWFVVVWNVVLFTLTYAGGRTGAPKYSEFDLRRCYVEPSTRYWDGELGYRVAKPQDFHSQLVCWPKNGCWLAENGDAVCWRVVKLRF